MTLQPEAKTREKSNAEQGGCAAPSSRPRLIRADTATKQRQIGRPWAPGTSGNPAGRPRGAWSKRTSGKGLSGLMARKARPVLLAAITAAEGGDTSAMRIVLDRCLPRERLIRIELPKIRGAQDALKALAILLDCAAEGSITSAEAANLSALAKAYVDIDATQKLEARLAELERRLEADFERNAAVNHKALARRLAKIEAQIGGADDGTILVRAGMKGLHDALEQMRERRQALTTPLLKPTKSGLQGLREEMARVQRFMQERDAAELPAPASDASSEVAPVEEPQPCLSEP